MTEPITSTITPQLQEIITRSLVRDYNFDNCAQYVSVYQTISGVETLVYSNIAISGLTWASDENNYYIVFDIAIPYHEKFSGSSCKLKLFSKNNKPLAETSPFSIDITQGQTYIAKWKINVLSSTTISSI